MNEPESRESCGNCRFVDYSGYVNKHGGDVLECHRFPPVIVEHPSRPHHSTFPGESKYPQTIPEAWCGEWQKAIELEK